MKTMTRESMITGMIHDMRARLQTFDATPNEITPEELGAVRDLLSPFLAGDGAPVLRRILGTICDSHQNAFELGARTIVDVALSLDPTKIGPALKKAYEESVIEQRAEYTGESIT